MASKAAMRVRMKTQKGGSRANFKNITYQVKAIKIA
jgi:hypothetical protein